MISFVCLVSLFRIHNREDLESEKVFSCSGRLNFNSTLWLKPTWLSFLITVHKPSRWVANCFKRVQALVCVKDSLLAISAKQSPRVLATWMGPDYVEPWKSCKEGPAANWRRSDSECHRFETWCQQGVIVVTFSIKIYPSSRKSRAQHQFMCEMCWLTVHLFALHVRDVTYAQ